MKSLIIGKGEVGTSLYKVLSPYYKVEVLGVEDRSEGEVEALHICFPYSDEFENEVKRYIGIYNPKYTIVFSTVPIGTCKKLGVVHSPVEGMHPYLDSSIRNSVRFLGGGNAQVANYFRRANLKVYVFDKPETTELMKILSTSWFGLDVEYINDVKKQCKKFKVPFEAWTLYIDNYNKMYKSLGHKEFVRPQLVPIKGEKIGGHCVLSNCDLLKTKFTKFIQGLNK